RPAADPGRGAWRIEDARLQSDQPGVPLWGLLPRLDGVERAAEGFHGRAGGRAAKGLLIEGPGDRAGVATGRRRGPVAARPGVGESLVGVVGPPLVAPSVAEQTRDH